MTVGVAASCRRDDDPVVILAADRLITTQQQSRIEHEHQESKLNEVASRIPTVDACVIVAGDVSWGEELRNDVDARCERLLRTDDSIHVGARELAEIAANCYREFVKEKIDRRILAHFGIGLEDLRAQHRFKERFVDKITTEIDNAERTIHEQLNVLLGAVDDSGSYIYEIRGGDYLGRNDVGCAAVGSGVQPALSEFIESEYSRECEFDTGLATVAAATMRARQASGVGGTIDVSVVGESYIEDGAEAAVDELMERYRIVSETQDAVKENLLQFHSVEWRVER